MQRIVTYSLLILSFLLLDLQQVFAASNVELTLAQEGFYFFDNIIKKTRYLVFLIFAALSEEFLHTYSLLVLLFMSWYCFEFYRGKPPFDAPSFLKQLAIFLIVWQLVFVKGNFESWLFFPVYNTIYNLAGFVLQTASQNIVDSEVNTQNYDAMHVGIKEMESVFGKIILSGYKTILQEQFYLSNLIFNAAWGVISFVVMSVILLIIFSLLKLLVVVLFTWSMVSAIVYLAAAPIVMPMAAFPQTSRYFFNMLRGFFSNALSVVFMAVAIGLTIYIMQDINTHFEEILKHNDYTKAQVRSVFSQAILMGVFSFFLIFKSRDFAANIVGSGGGSFGNMLRRADLTSWPGRINRYGAKLAA